MLQETRAVYRGGSGGPKIKSIFYSMAADASLRVTLLVILTSNAVLSAQITVKMLEKSVSRSVVLTHLCQDATGKAILTLLQMRSTAVQQRMEAANANQEESIWLDCYNVVHGIPVVKSPKSKNRLTGKSSRESSGGDLPSPNKKKSKGDSQLLTDDAIASSGNPNGKSAAAVAQALADAIASGRGPRGGQPS